MIAILAGSGCEPMCRALCPTPRSERDRQAIGGRHLSNALEGLEGLAAFTWSNRKHVWHGLPREAESLVVDLVGATRSCAAAPAQCHRGRFAKDCPVVGRKAAQLVKPARQSDVR